MSNTAVTLTTFLASLRSRLGNSNFWTDDELSYAINETFRTWNLLTGDWSGREVITSVAGTAWHSIPSTITSSTRVEYRGSPLKKTSLRDLDNGKPGWEVTTGVPKYWAPIALNLIAIYPIPLLSDNSLTADGVIASPVPIVEEEVVILDRSLYDCLLDYARHLLLFKLGGAEFEASKASHKALWEFAGNNNQKLQASAPYRQIMGFPLDTDQQPYRAGAKKVGLR